MHGSMHRGFCTNLYSASLIQEYIYQFASVHHVDPSSVCTTIVKSNYKINGDDLPIIIIQLQSVLTPLLDGLLVL